MQVDRAGGVEQSLQPGRGQCGEPSEHGPASSRAELVLRGGAQEVGQFRHDNQAGVFWKQLLREIGIDGEIQRIGEIAVEIPFPIGAEISSVGLDLDADEATIRPQGQYIGTAAVGERHLMQRRPAECQAQPTRGTADPGCAVGGRRGVGRRGGGTQRISRSVCRWPWRG